MIIHCESVRYIWEVLENQEYNFLFNDLTVFDIGCNIGTFSLWIYPHAQRIYAVDMSEEHINNFNKTIRDNELKNITTYIERILNLEEFMSGHAIPLIDILKLDVEGDEISILQSPTFPKDKIRTIVGEFHNQPVHEWIDKLGYRYFEYPNNHFVART